MARCVHCGERRRAVGKLCFECRAVPGLIEQYDGRRAEREPTAEEVEAIIAEQMQCLPDWWWEDVAARAAPQPGWTVPVLRLDRRCKGEWRHNNEGGE